MQKPPLPWLAITYSLGAYVIVLLIGHIFYATVHRIAKVEDDRSLSCPVLLPCPYQALNLLKSPLLLVGFSSQLSY